MEDNTYEGELDEEGNMFGYGKITSKKSKVSIEGTFYLDCLEGLGE